MNDEIHILRKASICVYFYLYSEKCKLKQNANSKLTNHKAIWFKIRIKSNKQNKNRKQAKKNE